MLTDSATAVRAEQFRRLVADEWQRLERTSDACRSLIDGAVDTRPELAPDAERWRADIASTAREGMADLTLATEAAIGRYAVGELTEDEAVDQVESFVLAVRHRMTAAQRVAAYGVYELEAQAPAVSEARPTPVAAVAGTAAVVTAPNPRAKATTTTAPSREGAPRRAAAALVAAVLASVLVLGGVILASEVTKDDGGGGESTDQVADTPTGNGGANADAGNANNGGTPPADANPPADTPPVAGAPSGDGSSAASAAVVAPPAGGPAITPAAPASPSTPATPPPSASPSPPPGTNPPPTIDDPPAKPNVVCDILGLIGLC